jgi:TolB-like protein
MSLIFRRIHRKDHNDDRLPTMLPSVTLSKRGAIKSAVAIACQSLPDRAAGFSLLRHPAFNSAVKTALRDFSRPDLLAASPLLRSHLLPERSVISPAELRNLLAATADELFANPRDEKLRRIIDLTYFRPVPKQEAAAERLGMAYSTYRRHLTVAIRRIAARLWEREQAALVELAAPTGKSVIEEPGNASQYARLSIVVLPFLTLGPDELQDYLANGITESLTTDLSRIPEAFVIARHTAFSNKGKALDVKQLGSELGVRYVLEGSVQRCGSRLRINIQLVDAGSGAHLWAERFDRDLGDIFELQDAIVTRVVQALDAKLGSPEAYDIKCTRTANPKCA